MQRKAIIFGHADGDGHLTAEQSRENLVKEEIEVTDVIVDPKITANYKFWNNHFPTYDFDDANIIVVVDIMLNPRDPVSSYTALAERARLEPKRKFIVIDHHLSNALLPPPKNVHLSFVNEVYKCCYGAPSELMLMAAICDHDEKPVKSQITDTLRRRAKGISRAVSDRIGLAGKPTLELIRKRAWGVFEQLADEPVELHKTFYGNRVDKEPKSPIIQVAHAMRVTM